MANPVKIVAILVARPGKTDALKALIDGMIGPSRAEPGNLRWDVWQDQADPARFVLDELYTDNAAIAAHRQTPHFLDYLAKIGDVAERTSMVLDAVEITP
jgi:quinol monooxygenase YgiN